MKRSIAVSFIMFLIIAPLHSQAKKGESKKTEVKKSGKDGKKKQKRLGAYVYFEEIIENFEETEYTEKNLIYTKRADHEWAGIAIRDQYPAPIKESKKYLGVKLYGKKGNALQIIPPKNLIIDKYCKSISVWVYGKNISGELSLLVMDAVGTTHRLVLGVLDYPGWRKLTVRLKRNIKQEDQYLNQKKNLKIIKILYKPFSTTRLPREHRFYIDDISVMVRDKYIDRQDDTW